MWPSPRPSPNVPAARWTRRASGPRYRLGTQPPPNWQEARRDAAQQPACARAHGPGSRHGKPWPWRRCRGATADEAGRSRDVRRDDLAHSSVSSGYLICPSSRCRGDAHGATEMQPRRGNCVRGPLGQHREPSLHEPIHRVPARVAADKGESMEIMERLCGLCARPASRRRRRDRRAPGTVKLVSRVAIHRSGSRRDPHWRQWPQARGGARLALQVDEFRGPQMSASSGRWLMEVPFVAAGRWCARAPSDFVWKMETLLRTAAPAKGWRWV